MIFNFSIKAECPKDLSRLLNKLSGDAGFIFEIDTDKEMFLDCNDKKNVVKIKVENEEIKYEINH